MAIPGAFIGRRRSVAITRPDRRGPGGDVIGTPAAIATLTALVFASTARLRTTPDGDTIQLTAKIYCDEPLLTALVQDEDTAAWTDEAGIATSIEIKRIVRHENGGATAHTRLEV